MHATITHKTKIYTGHQKIDKMVLAVEQDLSPLIIRLPSSSACPAEGTAEVAPINRLIEEIREFHGAFGDLSVSHAAHS